MSLIVEESVKIRADPEDVWRLLAEPASWSEWWRDCHFAEISGGKRLDEGSRLQVVLQPRYLKMTFWPEVDLCTEGKTLSLTYRSVFSQWTVSWHLNPGEVTTQVTARGVFQGPFIFFMRILQQGHTPRLILHGQLRNLKRIAERMR